MSKPTIHLIISVSLFLISFILGVLIYIKGMPIPPLIYLSTGVFGFATLFFLFLLDF